MYKIKRQIFGSLEMLVMQGEDEQSSASVIPSFGGNVLSLRLEKKGEANDLLDGFKTEKALRNNEKSRNILLAPFPNRTRDGKYFFGGNEYRLPVNKPIENNAIHGFLWNRIFHVVNENADTNSCSVELEHSYKGDYPGYPFPFLMRLHYVLHKNSFSIELSALNTGNESLPFGAGWHPYFTYHKPVDNLQLQLPSCNMLETDDRMIPTGKRNEYKLFQTLTEIDSAAFDTAFELSGNPAIFETLLIDEKNQLTITIQQDAAFRYLQVYVPPGRKSIAIEPMTCPANAINSKEGLLELKPGDRFHGKISVGLS